MLLVLRAITLQPLRFWMETDWVAAGSQHLVETEVGIIRQSLVFNKKVSGPSLGGPKVTEAFEGNMYCCEMQAHR